MYFFVQALRALRTFFITVVSLLDPQGNTSLHEQAADELIAFETKLAEVHVHVCITEV